MGRRLFTTILLFIIFCLSAVAQDYGKNNSLDSINYGEDNVSLIINAKVDYEKNQVIFDLDINENYHITDKKNGFFFVKVKDGGNLKIESVDFPEPLSHKGEKVYRGIIKVIANVSSLKPFQSVYEEKFIVGAQLCQEFPNEQCMPPEEHEVSVKIEKSLQGKIVKEQKEKSSSVENEGEDLGFFEKIENLFQEELKKNGSLMAFILVFLLGVGISFTPCVFPVIPIVMGFIGSGDSEKKSKWQGMYLSIFFVLGLSTVYSLLGVIAAKAGSMMGEAFQNPIVIFIIGLVFISMGLSMAGFFTIPVPQSIASQAQKGRKSKVLGALIVGGASGFIAAPCVGPVLVALLSWISQSANLFLGFWLMFVFSLGMGVIFIVVGTFSGILSAGSWMEKVKYVFSIILIGGGLYYLNQITSAWIMHLLWGTFLISIPVFGGLFDSVAEENKEKFIKLLFILILITGIFFFFKGLDIKFYPQSLQAQVQKEALHWETDIAKAKERSIKEGKILLIDSAADWCAACKELEENTFSNKEVQKRLNDFVLLRLDFTKKNEKNQKLIKEYKIKGMPTLIFYSQGKEIKRFSGYKKPELFLKFIDKL